MLLHSGPSRLSAAPWPLIIACAVFKVRENTHKHKQISTPPTPYRSLPGPPGPRVPKESPKSLPGSSGSKKCPKQSQNSLRSQFRGCFETVSRPFRTLFGPRGGDSLETLVRGRRGCNISEFAGLSRDWVSDKNL